MCGSSNGAEISTPDGKSWTTGGFGYAQTPSGYEQGTFNGDGSLTTATTTYYPTPDNS